MMFSGGRSKVFEKKIGGPNLGPAGLNQAQNEVFHHFLELKTLVFLEIACNYSLQQFITSIRGKPHKKNFGGPGNSIG